MNTSSSDSAKNSEVERIVQGLFDLRDSLVEVSLCLRDFQFEIDTTGLKAALAQTLQVLENAKSRAQ